MQLRWQLGCRPFAGFCFISSSIDNLHRSHTSLPPPPRPETHAHCNQCCYSGLQCTPTKQPGTRIAFLGHWFFLLTFSLYVIYRPQAVRGRISLAWILLVTLFITLHSSFVYCLPCRRPDYEQNFFVTFWQHEFWKHLEACDRCTCVVTIVWVYYPKANLVSQSIGGTIIWRRRYHSTNYVYSNSSLHTGPNILN